MGADACRIQDGAQAASNRSADLKRWRICALHDIKHGRGIRTFESDAISDYERNQIQASLECGVSIDEVKQLFKAAIERDARPKVNAVGNGGHRPLSKIDWRSVPLA